MRDFVTSRRTFLRGALTLAGAAGVTGLAGCNPFGEDDPRPPESHDLDGFFEGTVALANSYTAAITAVPALETTLGPLRDAHRAHVTALADALGRSAPEASTGAPPTDRASALSSLAAAEKAGRDAAVTACLAAAPRYAALVGSIAAARATHLEILK